MGDKNTSIGTGQECTNIVASVNPIKDIHTDGSNDPAAEFILSPPTLLLGVPTGVAEAVGEVAVVNPDAVDSVPTVLVLFTTALLTCATEEGTGWVDVSDGIGLDREPVIPVILQKKRLLA